MGPKVINEIAMLGTMFPAEEAKRLGIINQVVPDDTLDEAAMKMADKLLAKNTFGLTRIKWLNYVQPNMSIESAVELGIEVGAWWFSTDDTKEGLRAFGEKRKADYEQFRGKIKPVR